MTVNLVRTFIESHAGPSCTVILVKTVMVVHFSEDGHGRSWTVILVRTLILVWMLMDGHFLRTLMGGHFLRTLMDAHGRWVDAQATFEDAGKNWSRDENATVTVAIPNHKKDCTKTYYILVK